MSDWPSDVEYVAKDFGDWVACQWPDGSAVAFNRVTGRWCKIPHPDCPIVLFQGLFVNSAVEAKVEGAYAKQMRLMQEFGDARSRHIAKEQREWFEMRKMLGRFPPQ